MNLCVYIKKSFFNFLAQNSATISNTVTIKCIVGDEGLRLVKLVVETTAPAQVTDT